MSNTYYKSGQWNAICDRCGFEYKSSQLRKTWDGLMVCNKDWEQRNAQEFVRGVSDQQAPSWTRPEPKDGLVQIGYSATISIDASSGSDFNIGILTGNTTIASPSNPTTSQVISISFTQDGIGNRTVIWNAVFTGVTLSSSGKKNETATEVFRYTGTNWVQAINTPSWI